MRLHVLRHRPVVAGARRRLPPSWASANGGDYRLCLLVPISSALDWKDRGDFSLFRALGLCLVYLVSTVTLMKPSAQTLPVSGDAGWLVQFQTTRRVGKLDTHWHSVCSEAC